MDVCGCCARRVAVLGDMLELGEASRDAHEELGDVLAGLMLDGVRVGGGLVGGCESGVVVLDRAVLIGEAMGWAADRLVARGVGSDRVVRFASSDEAGDWVRGEGLMGEWGGWRGVGVLLKGSRGMGVEVVGGAIAEVLGAGETVCEVVAGGDCVGGVGSAVGCGRADGRSGGGAR